MSSTTILENRAIIITGAAGVLGRVAAKACAAQGAKVILLDKNIPGLEEVYDEVLSLNGAKPAIYPLDLAGASEQHYHELADVIAKNYRSLNGLLHNAASFTSLGPVESIETLSWSTNLNVNLYAPILMTRALLPLLKTAKDASIVFTSDSSALNAKAFWGPYGVSKIAIDGFSRILADELENKKTIRVNTLIPGAVQSPLRAKAFPGESVSRLANPESLARIYVYLFGPESSNLNGKAIRSDYLSQQRRPCTNKKVFN